MAANAPLGLFDSGLGGLTVAAAIRARLPHEDIVYLGDTARVPYGTRSPETVVRYARACARHIVGRGIKVLVVACNTVSAHALDALRAELSLPVLGVIEPGSRAAAAQTRSGRIGVIATQGTINSHAYARALRAIDPTFEVFEQPAPLLVPLVEEGWVTGDVPRLAATRYLSALAEADIDTLVLGCTHYPVLRSLLREVAHDIFKREVAIIDSGDATAAELSTLLRERDLEGALPSSAAPPSPAALPALTVMATDTPVHFRLRAETFLLGTTPDFRVELVDL